MQETKEETMKTLTVTFDVTNLDDNEIAALTGEIIVQGEASDSDEFGGGHGEAPFLTESVVETATNDKVTAALAAMLTEGATPDFSVDKDEILTGTGRGPSGKLRNFRQMNGNKLIDVCDAIMDENNDEEAMEAISAEMKSRGL